MRRTPALVEASPGNLAPKGSPRQISTPSVRESAALPSLRLDDDGAISGATKEESSDAAFSARHQKMEDKERRANKAVDSTPSYRQAVERAMQRARDAEKARRREHGMADLAGIGITFAPTHPELSALTGMHALCVSHVQQTRLYGARGRARDSM